MVSTSPRPPPWALRQLEHPASVDESAIDAATRYKEGVLARRLVPTLIGLALTCITLGASANGRFPKAQAIASVPGSDGSTVFLRTTFGILVSRDGGARWRWICERALGYEGTWDPPVAATRDGRLWVGLDSGLVSTVDGCRVDDSPELAGETVKDLTTDARGETLWAITGTPGKKSWVWRRSPGGPWKRLGSGLDDVNVMTIEVAPSKPSRVYVSGQPYSTIRGRLYRSDDGGATLVGEDRGLAAEGPFFIAAIDPKDPDTVLVRHLHTTGSDLLRTTDGGKTFANVLSMKSAMFGFAKSADGKTYWAGSGLAEHGIFRSSDRGATFEPIAKHGVLCLHAAPGERLFACENPFTLGTPAVALSGDAGKSFRALATFGDVEGPVACGGAGAADGGDAGLVPRPDAGAALCGEAAWAETKAFVTPRAPAELADAGVDAGAEAAAPAARSSRCGCRAVGQAGGTPDPLWLIAGLVPLGVWARARARRGSKRAQPGPTRSSRGLPSARR